ncbi:type IV pilus assembly protein PilE [Elusimicrobium simillimum]|uniref:type IV pilin protein n=1 Tax=Elusimicrobium simillimum TaxID=3143438 RepID=UPI003C6ED0B2
MKKYGFTLIELLVVVLIIGILAAIALPQYTRAVDKSRLAEAQTNLRSLSNAQEIYYMTHAAYTTLEELDIEIPVSQNYTYGISDNKNFIFAVSSKNGPKLELYLQNSTGLKDVWVCRHDQVERRLKLCRNLGCKTEDTNWCILN